MPGLGIGSKKKKKPVTATAAVSTAEPVFEHPQFVLEDNDRLVRRLGGGGGGGGGKQKEAAAAGTIACGTEAVAGAGAGAGAQQQEQGQQQQGQPSHEEYEGLVDAVAQHVKALLQARFGLAQHWIPAEDAAARCDVLVSPEWDTAATLLVVLQNHVGAQLGLWSRSTCLSEGLRAGSMLPFLERARAQGYAVIVCNANLNSVVRRGRGKVAIRDSAFPEEHAMYVYDNLVAQSKARRVLLFGFGNGAALCKEMLQRQLVRSRQEFREGNRIAGIATVEASVLIQEDDSADVKAFLARRAVDWESSAMLPPGHAIGKTRAQLGVSQALSVGCPPPAPSSSSSSSPSPAAVGEGGDASGHHHHHHHYPPSTTWSLGAALNPVFRFYAFCLQEADKAPAALAPPLSPVAGGPAAGAAVSPTPRGDSEEEEGNLGYRFAVEEAARLGVAAPPAPTPRQKQQLDNALAKTLVMGSPTAAGPRGEGADSMGSSPRSPRLMSSPRGNSPRSPGKGGLLSRWRRMVSGLGSSGSDSGSSSSGFSAFNFSLGSPRRSPRGGGGGGGATQELQRSSSERGSGSVEGGCRTMALTERLGIADFDLLKVVGKGAFGKVMLVRKKGGPGPGPGAVYAMKVLSKEAVVRKGQIQHTLSERAILCEIRHPFIVRLRFAFQSDASLYLVTDFYTGGSLFYHLRKNQSFPEARAKFYAAELLLALEHLHRNFVIYRDLKLENILIDGHGPLSVGFCYMCYLVVNALCLLFC